MKLGNDCAAGLPLPCNSSQCTSRLDPCPPSQCSHLCAHRPQPAQLQWSCSSGPWKDVEASKRWHESSLKHSPPNVPVDSDDADFSPAEREQRSCAGWPCSWHTTSRECNQLIWLSTSPKAQLEQRMQPVDLAVNFSKSTIGAGNATS